jgi:hypothetical protein
MRIAYFILLSLCFSSCRLAKQSVSPIQPETDFAILVADNHEIWVKIELKNFLKQYSYYV